MKFINLTNGNNVKLIRSLNFEKVKKKDMQ